MPEVIPAPAFVVNLCLTYMEEPENKIAACMEIFATTKSTKDAASIIARYPWLVLSHAIPDTFMHLAAKVPVGDLLWGGLQTGHIVTMANFAICSFLKSPDFDTLLTITMFALKHDGRWILEGLRTDAVHMCITNNNMSNPLVYAILFANPTWLERLGNEHRSSMSFASQFLGGSTTPNPADVYIALSLVKKYPERLSVEEVVRCLHDGLFSLPEQARSSHFGLAQAARATLLCQRADIIIQRFGANTPTPDYDMSLFQRLEKLELGRLLQCCIEHGLFDPLGSAVTQMLKSTSSSKDRIAALAWHATYYNSIAMFQLLDTEDHTSKGLLHECNEDVDIAQAYQPWLAVLHEDWVPMDINVLQRSVHRRFVFTCPNPVRHNLEALQILCNMLQFITPA